MRETTYGWYPSGQDIYRPKGRPSSHHLESLYNFKNYQAQIVSHQPELRVRGVSSATQPCTPQDIKRKSKSVPVPKLYAESKIYIPTPIQCWSKNKTPSETYWGLIDDLNPQHSKLPSEVSWPLLQDSNQQQQNYQDLQKQLQQQLLKTHIQQQSDKHFVERNQTVQNIRGFHIPSQDQSILTSEASSVLTWPGAHGAHKAFPLRPQSSYSGQSTPCQEKIMRKQRPASTPLRSSNQGQRDPKSNLTPAPPSGENTSASKWHGRIQSATVRREKASQPARPVTAGIMRQTAQEELADPNSHHSEQEMPPKRPSAPVPFAVRDTTCDLHEDIKLPRTPSPDEDDYETIVDKYGWRAQVHGDPYQLKKPMKRHSYTVKCSAPELQSAPPVVHMESKEPFFYSTIPRKPLSFSVDREWMSEVILAKRLELQKRDGGIKYDYKNFAFVY